MGNPTQVVAPREVARRGNASWQGRPWRSIVVFLAPALILYVGFIIYPVLATIFNSFHILRMDLGMQLEYVGITHYVELLTQDDQFRKAVTHSLVWAFVSPVVELLLAFVLAFMLYTKVRGWRIFRVAWFAPMLLAGVVVSVLWKWIYNYDWGIINIVLRTIGLNGLATNWLGDPDIAFPALIAVTTWMFMGFNMVIMLASMASIPSELLEAAQVDGATTRQVIRNIMFPLLRPTIANLAILSFIGKMKQFEIVWVMTRGGPMLGTETVATYVFKRAFDWRTLDLGYPSAIAVLWFVVILALTLILTRVLQRREVLEY
jgi:multiple sugar transport system permease protein/raffinose/stachyose/melibiose transport system permease protein